MAKVFTSEATGAGAKQIIDAQYDAETERLRLSFDDGVAEEVRLRQ
jgi:hypothetical protein